MVRRNSRIRTPLDLGLALQQARLARGMSQTELAEELEISQRSISEIENGKPTIYLQKVFELMRATGVEFTASWQGSGINAPGR